jgi:hypothetical protein
MSTAQQKASVLEDFVKEHTKTKGVGVLKKLSNPKLMFSVD